MWLSSLHCETGTVFFIRNPWERRKAQETSGGEHHRGGWAGLGPANPAQSCFPHSVRPIRSARLVPTANQAPRWPKLLYIPRHSLPAPQSHRKYHSKLSYLKIYTNPNKENANLRQDPHGQDHHPWGGALWHHRERQGQDPGKKILIYKLSLSHNCFLGQGGHPPRPAEVDLCWQAARGRKDPLWLQHPEGVHPSSCAPS